MTDTHVFSSAAVEPFFRHICLPLSVLLIGCFSAVNGAAAETLSNSAEQLRGRYVALEPALKNSPFKQPLLLESTETPSSLMGEVYAVINYPFANVDAELKDPDHWCDVLILHLNIKFCQAADARSSKLPNMPSSKDMTVHLGTKREQSLEDSYSLKFNFQQTAATSDYFQIQLNAPEGPLSTRNFRIMLEASPAANNQTFLHLTYAYDYGLAGKLAMKGYLATIGHDKVGFTKKGGEEGGPPAYVDGVRGLTERNTMRYYLAIDAYIKAHAQPADQFEKSLDYWFTATEQFPRQLYEIDRNAYLTMKRREYARQQIAP